MELSDELRIREFVFTFICGLFVCFGIANLICNTSQDALWVFVLAYFSGMVARTAREYRTTITIQDQILELLIKDAAENNARNTRNSLLGLN